MSRGRRALSISISNWPSLARSPRRAARSLSSAGAANSAPESSTKTTCWPSALNPTSLSLRMSCLPALRLGCFPTARLALVSIAGTPNLGSTRRWLGHSRPYSTPPAGGPRDPGGDQAADHRDPVRRRGAVGVDDPAGDGRTGSQPDRDSGGQPGHAFGEPRGRNLGL